MILQNADIFAAFHGTV